jgi:two-component system, chemotaxis family, protein-glutamate methylesterase/glutaminase
VKYRAKATEFPVIAIGASAGALDAVRCITEALPRDCAAAIVVVFHVGAIPSRLPEILNWRGKLPALFAEDGAALEPGHIYVAPPDHHVLLERPGRIRLDRGSKVHNTRPAADPLFASAAATFGTRVVGVVLGGRSEDGAIGLRKIKDYGGLALVHDPEEALVPQMPAAAVVAAVNAEVLRIERLARRVAQFCAGTGAAMSTATERLARRLVAGVARTSTVQWVKLQDVEQRLGFDRASAQAAVRVAVDRGWVIAEGPCPHSVCRLTDAGRALPRPR